MPPLVSVIIPIYNVAFYLRECLDSVINQTYLNLQVILVNDGSTDESESIAKEYLDDSRIELVNVENGGLSYARNIGLDLARGEYIYFIDSDDYIHQEFIQELVELAQKYKVKFVCNNQIVQFGLRESNLKKYIEPNKLKPNSQSIVLGGAVWRCLFARSLIDRSGVRFLEGKIYEDEGFLYMILPFVQEFVKFVGLPYYHRNREQSIMQTYRCFRSYDLLDIFEAIYLFYQKRGFLSWLKPPYYFLIDCAYGYKNEKEYLIRAKQLVKKLGIVSVPLHMESLEEKRKFRTFLLFPVWFFMITIRLSKLFKMIKNYAFLLKIKIKNSFITPPPHYDLKALYFFYLRLNYSFFV